MAKTVLITGASRGIGRACAEIFIKNGWQVAAVYNKTMPHLDCKAYQCDVANPESIAALKTQIDRDFGHIDVLVNNAGVSLFGVFQSLDPACVRQMYEVNLFGTLGMTRAFVGDMVNRKSGCVVNISSIFGIFGASCEADYAASKAAIIGLTKSLAKELGPSGVRVNCVAPGVIDTDMNSRLTVREVQELVEEIPLECLGTPENVASAVFFLAQSEYITGAVLEVSGGK